MADQIAFREDNIEEVFQRAQDSRAKINGIIKQCDNLDYQDFDDIFYNLQMIERRTDPAQWRDYDEER